ncbi:hypothetical protein LSH36_203g01037 [Paralvinella palmiformis]|uniref:Uncharacterized protein n=1 Tax=Paralvinella palmiformis TaxID=53620 RepID=A0AAD9N6J4_9ANNE|nr:hypothetical protein LSH36_203g01037 [Paralvinella palmiformis]
MDASMLSIINTLAAEGINGGDKYQHVAVIPVILNDSSMARVAKIITLIACVCIGLLVAKLLFSPTSSRLSGAGNEFAVRKGHWNLDAIYPLRNKTMLNAIKGKEWGELTRDEKTFLIRRWLCKKRNCNLM